VRDLACALFIGIVILALACPASAQNKTNRSPEEWSSIIRAAHEVETCLQDARMRGWELRASVETVSTCFAGGFVRKVAFLKTRPCYGKRCPRAPDILVATVTFNCDGAIASSECYSGSNTCTTDKECHSNSWCRPTQDGTNQCVPFVGEGKRCEGFVLPWTRERCEPNLTCVPTEPTGDVPGICATCNYNGVPYSELETFLADDGCNMCICNAGGLIACTERACLPGQ